MVTLVTGGARSGKSAFAEKLAASSRLETVYVATAVPNDAEMEHRVLHHRSRRPAEWRTIEEPIHLAGTLQAHARADRCLIVDCLTLWLSNLLGSEPYESADVAPIEPGPIMASEISGLLDTLPRLPGIVLLVGNELGSGIVPLSAVSRFFADTNGRLLQSIAERSARVYWVVAGCPVLVKDRDVPERHDEP